MVVGSLESAYCGYPCACQVCNDFEHSCFVHEGRQSVYLFTGADANPARETQRFSPQVNARQNKMHLLHDAMMEILRPLADAGSASLEKEGVKKDVRICFLISMVYC